LPFRFKWFATALNFSFKLLAIIHPKRTGLYLSIGLLHSSTVSAAIASRDHAKFLGVLAQFVFALFRSVLSSPTTSNNFWVAKFFKL